MKLKTFMAVFSVFTLIYSCKKTDNKTSDTQEITSINGKIKFPIGSNLNSSGCSLNSYITEQTLSNDNYTVDVISNDFNVQFLTSSNGKELMLGYTYPLQTDFTIDSKSTLLALVMKLPTVNSLSTVGKLNLINKIKSSPGYINAIDAIEAHIISGKDIFDTTDIDMQQKIASLFDYAATHRQGFGYDGQVYVNKNGRTVTFGNPGVSIAQIIGIYQGNSRIAKLELDRYKTFVTSITDIPSAINNPPAPIEVKYDFQNDGVYQIKIRSGGFNLPNNDLESNEAIVSNAINFTIDNIKIFIPIDLSKDCPEAVYNAVKSKVDVFKNAMKSSLDISAFLGIGYNLTKAVIQSIIINSICISGNAGKISYLEKISKYLKWLDFVGKVGTSMNNSIFITDFFIATKSSLDTTLTIGAANIDPTVAIGTQTWTVKNLAVTKYRNGDSIPHVTNNSQWNQLTTGAWRYYQNDSTFGSTYGKLYNWYAVNDPRGLAPQGFHIPTDNEWVTLSSFLGGTGVAGGPMKEIGTTHWLSPNTLATNSSGFTGLPGGFYEYYLVGSGSFDRIGANGYWWSSTQDGLYRAWGVSLASYNGYTERWSSGKTYGVSVRCIKD